MFPIDPRLENRFARLKGNDENNEEREVLTIKQCRYHKVNKTTVLTKPKNKIMLAQKPIMLSKKLRFGECNVVFFFV